MISGALGASTHLTAPDPSLEYRGPPGRVIRPRPDPPPTRTLLSLLVLPTRGSLQELAVSFLKGNLEADLMALKEGGWFVDYWYCSICEAAIEGFQREEESGNFREIV